MMAKERVAVKGGVSGKGEGALNAEKEWGGGVWEGVGSSSGGLGEGGHVCLSLNSFITQMHCSCFYCCC